MNKEIRITHIEEKDFKIAQEIKEKYGFKSEAQAVRYILSELNRNRKFKM